MVITESAKRRLEEVLDVGECMLVGLKGGGCGGATIELLRGDSTSSGGLSIGGTTSVMFADTTSAQYLTAGTLDYVDDMLSATFVFKPPLGIESCGCGASIKL
jgi:iron-sulfur cluster insertion protein